MGTNMMPQQPDSPAELGGYPPAFAKAADSASTSLAQMFKICHQQEPDSPLCDALQNMIKAVAEIENRAGMPGGGSPEEPMPEDQGAPPVPEEEAPAPPMGSGNPDMAQAAQEAHQMMLAEQSKKRPMMGA